MGSEYSIYFETVPCINRQHVSHISFVPLSANVLIAAIFMISLSFAQSALICICNISSHKGTRIHQSARSSHCVRNNIIVVVM